MNANDDIIYKIFLKPNYDTRTFETRLLFIKELFEHTFSRTDIMGRCVLHKLKRSLETYQEEVNKSSQNLKENNNPVTILSRLSKLN